MSKYYNSKSELDTLIHEYQIIGTRRHIYEVLEPSALGSHGEHSTISTVQGQWYGRLGTNRLPADLDALPAWSKERSDAVRAWHEELYQRAYRLICEVCPEAHGGKQEMGEISLQVPFAL